MTLFAEVLVRVSSEPTVVIPRYRGHGGPSCSYSGPFLGQLLSIDTWSSAASIEVIDLQSSLDLLHSSGGKTQTCHQFCFSRCLMLVSHFFVDGSSDNLEKS